MCIQERADDRKFQYLSDLVFNLQSTRDLKAFCQPVFSAAKHGCDSRNKG